MRRFIFGLLAAAILVALQAPASAQTGVSVSLQGVGADEVIQGHVYIYAEANAPTGVKKLELFVGDTLVAKQEPNDIKNTVKVDYSWNTTQILGGGGLSRNGRYNVRAVASSNGGGSEKQAVEVIVDNPAATPTGVAAEIADNNASLTWNPNPEPDIIGYQIERDSGTGFQIITTTTDNFFDEEVEPGDHTYRVAAVRSSVVANPGRVSAPSEAAPIHVAAPAPIPDARNGGGGRRASGKTGGVPNRAFAARGRSIAVRGLSGFVSLPGVASLPDLPRAEVPWGDYEEELPYEVPEGGVPLQVIQTSAARSDDWKVIPPDGLRWVALGILFVVCAGLLRIVSIELKRIASP